MFTSTFFSGRKTPRGSFKQTDDIRARSAGRCVWISRKKTRGSCKGIENIDTKENKKPDDLIERFYIARRKKQVLAYSEFFLGTIQETVTCTIV
ncbi:hypothetical protein GWI33_017203 [Rhynchophorus ferrugineus]|uniref:Uncharacterized protein n=1 Tax=Rhynchophorus ferrugineus TaxID=354439 RepID=A0A834HZ35_RHYFE|nr:hypothetical protein GWI33_017203 [Rhynchophorus ferrugineus]